MQESKVFNTIQEKLHLTLFGSCDTLVTAVIIIATLFKLKDARAFVGNHYSKLGKYRASSVRKGKYNIGKEKFASLRKTYKILKYGGSLLKHNYTFHIYASKVVSLMQNFQGRPHLKADCLCIVTTANQNFKKLPVHESGVKTL